MALIQMPLEEFVKRYGPIGQPSIDNTVDPDDPVAESQQDSPRSMVHIHIVDNEPPPVKLLVGIRFDNDNSKIREIFWDKAQGYLFDTANSHYSPVSHVTLTRTVNRVSTDEMLELLRKRNGRDARPITDLDTPVVDIALLLLDGALDVRVAETCTRSRMEHIHSTMELVVKAVYDHLTK